MARKEQCAGVWMLQMALLAACGWALIILPVMGGYELIKVALA